MEETFNFARYTTPGKSSRLQIILNGLELYQADFGIVLEADTTGLLDPISYDALYRTTIDFAALLGCKLEVAKSTAGILNRNHRSPEKQKPAATFESYLKTESWISLEKYVPVLLMLLKKHLAALASGSVSPVPATYEDLIKSGHILKVNLPKTDQVRLGMIQPVAARQAPKRTVNHSSAPPRLLTYQRSLCPT